MTKGVSAKAPSQALVRARVAVARARADINTATRDLRNGRLLPARVELIKECQRVHAELVVLHKKLLEAKE